VDTWEVAARLEIEDTIGRYARYADSGRSQDLASLFTADGVLAAGDDEARGRAAITAYLEGNKTSLAAGDGGGRIRHHVSSLRIDLISETSARATCYFLAITGTGPDHWGVYRDELVHEEQRWRFARRTAIVEGHAAGGWAERRRA